MHIMYYINRKSQLAKWIKFFSRNYTLWKMIFFQ